MSTTAVRSIAVGERASEQVEMQIASSCFDMARPEERRERERERESLCQSVGWCSFLPPLRQSASSDEIVDFLR